METYNYGLIIGRFQMLHIGHVQMIQTALKLCNKVVLYISSAQESGTKKNPFSYDMRYEMLKSVFSKYMDENRLQIRPLQDIGPGNSDIWGRYILGLFESEFHAQPDLYITSWENVKSDWFNQAKAPYLSELVVSKNNRSLSAAFCRELLLDDEKEVWEKYVPLELHPNYDAYRKILMNVCRNAQNKEV